MNKSLWILIFSGIGIAFGAMVFSSEQVGLQVKNATVVGKILKIKSPGDGIIYDMRVKKGDRVSQGDELFTINAQINQMEIDIAVEDLRRTIRSLAEQCIALELDKNEHLLKEHLLTYHQERQDRFRKLNERNDLSIEALRNITHDTKIKEFELAEATVKLKLKQLSTPDNLHDWPELKNAQVELKKALYRQHSHTIRAPSDGYIYDVLTKAGLYTTEGETNVVFIPVEELKIEANVLESKIDTIEEQREVLIYSDIHKDKPLRGYIESVVPSTAATFSQLPRNNVDSNWIKVTQRIPVLIAIKPDETRQRAFLPIGSSVTVSIPLTGETINVEDDTIPESTEILMNQSWEHVYIDKVQQIITQEFKSLGLTLADQCQIAS